MSAIEEVSVPATAYAKSRAEQQGISTAEMTMRLAYVGEALLILEESKYAAFMRAEDTEEL